MRKQGEAFLDLPVIGPQDSSLFLPEEQKYSFLITDNPAPQGTIQTAPVIYRQPDKEKIKKLASNKTPFLLVLTINHKLIWYNETMERYLADGETLDEFINLIVGKACDYALITWKGE